MWLAQQAPGVPDANTLKDLPTPVAVLLLCLIALLAVLYYFGGALRDRVSRTPPPRAENTLASTAPTMATPAMDQANEMANALIDELRTRNRELSAKLDQQAHEIANLRDEVERLRLDLERERWRWNRP